jgi:regulatory protein
VIGVAGVVTALRRQKNNPERVNVFLDGEYAFPLTALVAAQLRIGQLLSDESIATLQAHDAVDKAYERAIRFLGYRPRSQAEIAGNLTKAGVEPETIDLVLRKLGDQGYLNDAEFAQYWVQQRSAFRPRGSALLRQELRAKGLARDQIEAALGQTDPENEAYRAAAPRAQRMSDVARAEPALFKRKLSEFLLRRGFHYEIVAVVVRRLLAEATGEAENDEVAE